MMQTDDLSEPLNDVEYEELDDFLLSVEHDDAMLNVSEFDGFITAVVSGPAAQSEPHIRPEPKVGRNDPCHCGSGRKYKKCCGAH